MLSLIPVSDANPTRRFSVVTLALILANVVMFLQEPLTRGGLALERYFFREAPIPCQLVNECPAGQIGLGEGVVVNIPPRGVGSFLWAVLISTFLHANFLHIAGNMLFLWVFGNNIEDHLGRLKFLLFYLAGGFAAAFAHVAWELKDLPCTGQSFGACVPAVGASGAVAAVMGAYLLLFPHARVNVLVPIFFFLSMVQMSAFAVLVLWFLYQFVIAAQELAGPSGVAWMAHVGGFVFGLIGVFLLGGRPQRALPAFRRWDPY
ncbi:MAG TPA: rhomboid family intramembrane serine protease [Actinomycetota bacterium]|nr:rhomboid family intramembrane serine protease [Actinomycetota bacterium]